MKNKNLIISFIIGIILFFPTSEVKASYICHEYDNGDDNCEKIEYGFKKDKTLHDTKFIVGIKKYAGGDGYYFGIPGCSGKGCNNDMIEAEFDNTSAQKVVGILGHSEFPIAICGHPKKYDSSFKGVNEKNYSKYVYHSYEEIENSICNQDDIYYTATSAPGENGDGDGTVNPNACLEAAGLRCMYRNVSDSNDVLEYGYTNVKGLKDYMLRKGRRVSAFKPLYTITECSCPAYVSFDKLEWIYSVSTREDYDAKKSDSNYIFFKYIDSKTIAKEEVNENGTLQDVLDAQSESDYSYEGQPICGIFGERTFGFIKSMYTIIKILIPVLIIVLGIVDFLKVVFSGEDKDMKASGTRFLKRIIAGIIFILLPALIEFLMSIVGFSEDCIQQLIK